MIIEGIEVEHGLSVFLATCQEPKTGKIYRHESRGHKFVLCGATWYLHRGKNGGWGITEASTGTYAAGGRTRATAIQDLNSRIRNLEMSDKKLSRFIRVVGQVIEDIEHGRQRGI